MSSEVTGTFGSTAERLTDDDSTFSSSGDRPKQREKFAFCTSRRSLSTCESEIDMCV